VSILATVRHKIVVADKVLDISVSPVCLARMYLVGHVSIAEQQPFHQSFNIKRAFSASCASKSQVIVYFSNHYNT